MNGWIKIAESNVQYSTKPDHTDLNIDILLKKQWNKLKQHALTSTHLKYDERCWWKCVYQTKKVARLFQHVPVCHRSCITLTINQIVKSNFAQHEFVKVNPPKFWWGWIRYYSLEKHCLALASFGPASTPKMLQLSVQMSYFRWMLHVCKLMHKDTSCKKKRKRKRCFDSRLLNTYNTVMYCMEHAHISKSDLIKRLNHPPHNMFPICYIYFICRTLYCFAS